MNFFSLIECWVGTPKWWKFKVKILK